MADMFDELQDPEIFFKRISVDAVRHILSYVSPRWNASLVCRAFYEICCDLDKHWLKLDLYTVGTDIS